MKVNQNIVKTIESQFIETPMSVSDFNKNARYDDIKSVINFVINLLFMHPGTIPEMPKMGYNLRGRRHFLMNDKSLYKQNEELQEQINKYVQSALISDVSLSPIKGESGEYDTTAIVIKFVTDQVINIYDDGNITKIGVYTDGKDFTK